MANLFGTGINQVPTNGMLGNLAFQDKAFVSVDKIGIGTTAVDTGTANQTLQNYGGAYISGNLGIGTTNPQVALDVVGNVRVVGVTTVGFITATNIWNAGITTSSRFVLNGANDTTTGGGQIYLNGTTGNRIDFNTNGSAAPAFTTRSAGTKIVLYPQVGASAVDFGFGIEANAVLWSSIPQANSVYAHRWYGGTTQLVDLKGSGELVIGSTTLTGTASQRLQVTGGAYVSGNLGIGLTNPTNPLTVYGTNNDTVPILALLSGNNSTSFNSGAQIAFGYNGTPTYQHFIQTRHNSANSSNAIDFYVSDGTQNNTLTSGSVHTMSLVSGSVGINTTNPGATLNVVPTSTSISGLFSGTTSSDMVRITQLGTGNALVVEDSANPDSSPFVVTGIGSVGIGTASPAFTADIAGDARVTSTNKMRFGGTAGTTNFYIQYNSTANSLDFVAG